MSHKIRVELKTVFRVAFILSSFILLTVLTQIGGIILLITVWLIGILKTDFRFKTLILFLALYFITTFLIVPFIAPVFGREKINHTNSIRPSNYMTVLLNRNYVRPELNTLLLKTADIVQSDNIHLRYLDANFPFMNNFPLLPHLSHKDGRKLDLSLVYQNEMEKIVSKQKSISGYGVFESPKSNEFNQINKCRTSGYFQYDYSKYLTFGKINDALTFSEVGTKKLISALLKNSNLEKLFIEPHLKSRLNITDSRVRYHGCRAVRHDDHIHIQINKTTHND